MLKMPSVFSDSMVLQRDKNIAVWGESDSDFVTVELNGKTVEAKTNGGMWNLYLPPLHAGGPYKMTIKSGNDCITYNDVMIGEVWLAGGQSNMELELKDCKGGTEIVKNASGDNVRFYYTPKVTSVGQELEEAESKSSWEKFIPNQCDKWSAVGYFFASMLSEKLGVTVGVIGCNWGGTSASCWISRKFLEYDIRIISYLKEYDNRDKSLEEAYNECPGSMHESMIKRVAPYTLAGFLYYQGEEDDHKPYTYYELLLTLVRQWRYDWQDDKLPFMLVQLPIYQEEGEPDYKNWPFIREAQMKLYDTVKNTGIAVILETGEYNNIHPVDKKTVGKRLMLQAMYHVYGDIDEKEAYGPIYDSYFVENGIMYIKFKYAETGIICNTEEECGFEIAGADKKYYPAKAVILGDSIALSSDKVNIPLYARYFWTNYHKVSLFGANGIPVAPFRTSTDDGAICTGSRNTGLFK